MKSHDLYLQRISAEDALRRANERLEQQVQLRTRELREANARLHADNAKLRAAEQRIESDQEQLRHLASELTLAEERERRTLARCLHDQVGQTLALVKLRLSELRGNAVFCGFEHDLAEIGGLVDRTIRVTRTLTVELSPPVLYELGLPSALEWLAEQFQMKHKIQATASVLTPRAERLTEQIEVTLFKAVEELLANVAKHAAATAVTIQMHHTNGQVRIAVRDDGQGFDVAAVHLGAVRRDSFGLFSIHERLRHIGGRMQITSQPGAGATVQLEVPTDTPVELHQLNPIDATG